MATSNPPVTPAVVEQAPSIRTAGATRPSRIRSAMVEPAEDARLERLPTWAGYLAGALLPLLVSLALAPFRDELQQGAAVVLIVPVVAVALVAGSRPAVVAALSAGSSFGVLLAQPYGQFAIHQGTDVIATVVLLLVGLVVGGMAVREQRLTHRAELRRDELEHLIAFAELSASADRPADLVDAAGDHLRSLLQLERCDWSDDRRDGSRPLLLDDGQLMGYLHDLPADRSELPPGGAVLLVQTQDAEIGSFVLVPAPGTTTSIEQRRTAAAVANLLALALVRDGAGAGRRPRRT